MASPSGGFGLVVLQPGSLTKVLGSCVGHNARRTIKGVARGGEQSLSTAGLEATGSEVTGERASGRPASARVSLPDVAECDNPRLAPSVRSWYYGANNTRQLSRETAAQLRSLSTLHQTPTKTDDTPSR